MANCLILLSKVTQNDSAKHHTSRVFTCKTCNKEFQSFQALGGHRASHKKPQDHANHLPVSPKKPKTHECSICGLEFALGQALGGHMRRHRSVAAGNSSDGSVTSRSLSLVPVTMKKTSDKRLFYLDLNLTPSENLKLAIAKVTPMVDCFT